MGNCRLHLTADKREIPVCRQPGKIPSNSPIGELLLSAERCTKAGAGLVLKIIRFDLQNN
jgi:hypothetical protein